MKISPAPAVVNSMTMATQPLSASLAPSQPQTASELPISDTNETKVEAEVTQPLSPQFAEIARRRRALQLKERALAEKEREIAARTTGSDQSDIISRLKSQPLNVLQEAGVTYDQLTEHLLASQGNAEVRALEAKIKALEEGVDKRFSEKDAQAEQQVLHEMQREAERLIMQDDSFELVKATKRIPDVMQLIKRTYKETGEVLDVSEALKLVEDELFEEATMLAGLNKVKSRFAPQLPAQPQTQPQLQTGMRTLKNSDTASIALSRRARALAAWNK